MPTGGLGFIDAAEVVFVPHPAANITNPTNIEQPIPIP